VESLTLTRPDDFHLHLRDGSLLTAVAPASATVFARALVMPNLVPPVTTTDQALAYRARILAAVPDGVEFQPLMTLYLTAGTDADEIDRAVASGMVHAVKLYPAGATTNSDAGVRDWRQVMPVLERMAERELPLCVHGEVVDADVDIFDREAAFIDRVLAPMLAAVPGLRVVFEHLTSAAAVAFVQGRDDGRVVGTLTPQHLLFNRNAMLVGGIRPHYYCLPILKRERDREALLAAATSGDPRFFLGTDSAPHPRHAKESACGCAGAFTAPHALALYARAFAEAGALQRLDDFASRFGAEFYRLPRNTGQVTLVRQPWQVPAEFAFAGGSVVPLLAGETLDWQVVT